jgi:hypothetical protein
MRFAFSSLLLMLAIAGFAASAGPASNTACKDGIGVCPATAPSRPAPSAWRRRRVRARRAASTRAMPLRASAEGTNRP